MKKLLLIVMTLSFAFGAFAQEEYSTIAEIKALASGTKCIYVGNATTTYYYDNYGVLIQDETGALLVMNKYLGASRAGDNDYTSVTTNMEISYIEGTFKEEDQMYGYIDYIEVKNADLEWIEIKNEKAVFEPEKVELETFVTKLDQYKGVAVQFDEVNIRSVNGSLNSEFYSLTSDAVLSVPFNNMIGTLPIKASIAGYVAVNYSGNIFKVGSKESVTPLAYNNIKDLKNGVIQYRETLNYELSDTFAVSHVMTLGNKKLVYIQEKDYRNPDYYDLGLRVEVPTSTEVTTGDYITGLYGTFRPYTGDSIAQIGASFFQNEESQIEVTGSGAECRAFSNYIYAFNVDNMQNAYRYESTLLTLSGGVITKNSDGSYSYVVEDENGQGKQTIGLVVSGKDDLSVYVGKECGIRGILDVANNYPNRQFTIIARSEADILLSNMKFATIAELIATGELGNQITYEITKPVLVTYKFEKIQGTPTYYFIIQDHTAGIVVDLGVEPMTSIVAGDSITNLRGVYNNMRGITTDFLAVDETLRDEIRVKNSGNEVKGIEVTFAEILADKKLYENRVVTVKGVTLGSVFHESSNVEEGCFVQNCDTIYYTTGVNSGGFTYYDYMNITGVVDNKVIGEYYSIWPLSQEHIVQVEECPTHIDELEANASVYSYNRTLFVEAPIGSNISVYSLQGQLLSAKQSVNNLTTIDPISENIVIVMVDNIAYKVVVK